MISNLLRADAPSDVPAPVKPRRYALDNAGKLYPSVATKDWSSVYRVSIMMRETVDATLLQKAVNRVLPRFPTMAVRLHRGFFWYTLEENLLPFIVRKDSGPICFRFRRDEDNGYLLRILYRERQISVEFFHSVTDGHGSLVFTKTLLAEYLRCCGYTVPSEKGVLDIRQAAPDRELEDAFMRMPLPREGLPRGGAEAFHLSGNPSPLKITSAYMSAQMVLEKARSMDTSVTEYLASAMLYAAVRLQAQSKPEKYKPVRISIPVDMRKYFETATLRNFSMYFRLANRSNIISALFPFKIPMNLDTAILGGIATSI